MFMSSRMSGPGHNPMRDHQGKYKYTTPPWKDVYRKRCLRRLQERRSRLVDRFRQVDESQSENSNLVQEVMEQEWDVLRKEKNKVLSSDSLQYNPFVSGDEISSDEDFNEIIDVMEEIQKELIKEEQVLMNKLKYEDSLNFEEERLCAAIERLQTDTVVCPVCKINPLLQENQIIFCSCGVKIDTESDGVTLAFVKTQLDDAVEHHKNQGCESEAVFSVSSYPELGVSNLIMACQSCDYVGIIV